MRDVRRLWWVVASAAIVFAGAFAPWATSFGHAVDGSDDELVGITGVVAIVALLVFAVTRNLRFVSVPLLAGLVSAMLVGHDMADPAGPFGGPGPNVHLDWGIWVVLAASISLLLASVALLTKAAGVTIQGRRLTPTRDADLRERADAKAARAAEKAAKLVAAAEVRWRRKFAVTARRLTPYVAIEKNGVLLFTSTEAEIGRARFAEREGKDDRQLDKAMLLLQSTGVDPAGTLFVDVGAHIGTSTIRALRRHRFASALCFEPEPDNFRILRANLAANDLDTVVRPFNVALSNHEGTAHLQLRKRGSGSHELVMEGAIDRRVVRVPVTSFDRLTEDGAVDPSEAGLLWIDVQGSEVEVLEGARRLLERSVPIVVEFSPSRFRAAARVDSFIGLLSSGYTHFFNLKPHFPSERGLQPLAEIEEIPRRFETQTDLLVLRRS
jgi:FkbM family methyltransferase